MNIKSIFLVIVLALSFKSTKQNLLTIEDHNNQKIESNNSFSQFVYIKTENFENIKKITIDYDFEIYWIQLINNKINDISDLTFVGFNGVKELDLSLNYHKEEKDENSNLYVMTIYLSEIEINLYKLI